MAKPAGGELPIPAPVPPPAQPWLGLDGGAAIPPEFFDTPPDGLQITPGQAQDPQQYNVPPAQPAPMTPFDEYGDPARTPADMGHFLQNHSIQPDGQLGYAAPTEPFSGAVMPPRGVWEEPGPMPGDAPPPALTAEAPMPTATPGRPGRSQTSGRPSFDQTPSDPDAVVRQAQAAGGLSTPWDTETKRHVDWTRYGLMKSAIDDALKPLMAPISGGQQASIPSEMRRPAPQWQAAGGFRSAFRPPSMAGMLQRGTFS